jgi:hypothetical protein
VGEIGVHLQPLEHLEAVAGRQSEVEQDQVRPLLARHADRGDAGGCERRRVAARAQADLQPQTDVTVVVDDQNRLHVDWLHRLSA